MSQRLTRGTALMLTVPPLMLNFLRWVIAFAILLPLAAWVLRRSGGMWEHWLRFAVLGLFGVGLYNTVQKNRFFKRHVSGPSGTDSRAQGCCGGSIGLAGRTLGSRNPTA